MNESMDIGFAVVAGHICLDIFPDMGQVPEGKLPILLQPGHLVITGPAVLSTGGPVSNTGLALHKLGIPTRLIAKVGKDPMGQIVRTIVEGFDMSLASGLAESADAVTSYSIILSAPGVDRIFIHCPGANDTFCAEDIQYELVAQARLFHFGYPPVMRQMYRDEGKGLMEVFQKAKATGVTTSLDMTRPDPDAEGGKADWVKILGKTLPYVDVFMPTFDELLFMLRRDVFDQMRAEAGGDEILPFASAELISSLGKQILEMGAKIGVIKLGDRGLYLRSAGRETLAQMGRGAPNDVDAWSDQELWSACFEVDVVGTTGAGDSTIAGFLAGMLRGLDPAEAVTAAVAVGACDVEAADALSGLRSWDDTQERVAKGWKRRTLDLKPAGWTEIGAGLWKR